MVLRIKRGPGHDRHGGLYQAKTLSVRMKK